MNSIDDLMGMIMTEAIVTGGEPENHHFDETKNRGYLPYSEPSYKREDSNLPPIKFRLEVIQKPGGLPYLVE